MATSEGFIPVVPEKVVDVGLALLERETTLAQTVWRDAFGSFTRAKNDTISLRLPAYAVANKRDLRSSDARVRSKLHQRKVDVSLDTDLQVDVPLTDEEMTLDLESISREISAPSIAAIVRGYEEEIAALMQNASYANTVTVDPQKPTHAFAQARRFLNDASVPMANRFAVIGSGFEQALLESDRLSKFDESGSGSALRDATIGRLFGFDRIIVSNFLDPFEGYAYHRTAYALATAAPVVPRGVAWGASVSRNGFAIRVMEHLSDSGTDIANIVYHDAWVGTNTVTDVGEIDENGKFIPAVDPDESGASSLLVRAVKLDASALEES